jgi:phenylpropionate dioxygenase-like ring-hydroxylating dioxygenase large terminal subunit
VPPEVDDIGTDRYTDWTWNVIDVPSAHCREIVDNVVDMAHFFYVHFAFPTNFRNVFEGHRATQFMESTGRPDMAGEGYGDEDLVLESVATSGSTRRRCRTRCSARRTGRSTSCGAGTSSSTSTRPRSPPR